ncbi:hypothetical protein TCON_2342 [Astathelohania contejeani]|uniref:Uncharacterized protein n=1 Tax=Astathelohania contejeani TaxID=164912 RepID=A0ABQ7HW95_9MICR|nr:hypothetical protein TCON_2342 [Thelohania contejeani]
MNLKYFRNFLILIHIVNVVVFARRRRNYVKIRYLDRYNNENEKKTDENIAQNEKYKDYNRTSRDYGLSKEDENHTFANEKTSDNKQLVINKEGLAIPPVPLLNTIGICYWYACIRLMSAMTKWCEYFYSHEFAEDQRYSKLLKIVLIEMLEFNPVKDSSRSVYGQYLNLEERCRQYWAIVNNDENYVLKPGGNVYEVFTHWTESIIKEVSEEDALFLSGMLKSKVETTFIIGCSCNFKKNVCTTPTVFVLTEFGETTKQALKTIVNPHRSRYFSPYCPKHNEFPMIQDSKILEVGEYILIEQNFYTPTTNFDFSKISEIDKTLTINGQIYEAIGFSISTNVHVWVVVKYMDKWFELDNHVVTDVSDKIDEKMKGPGISMIIYKKK